MKERAAAMDRVELEHQLEELHPASFAWALACCRRSRDDAEEVLQTVYMKILEGKARFDGRSALKTWVFGVIRRTALEHVRRQILSGMRLLRWWSLRPSATADTAEESLARSEAAAKLLRAMRALSRRQREVLELVFYHDMTIEEAAETLLISIGSARVHYDRGKKRLLGQLEGVL